MTLPTTEQRLKFFMNENKFLREEISWYQEQYKIHVIEPRMRQGTTTGDRSKECVRETAKSQGWESKAMTIKSTMTDGELNRILAPGEWELARAIADAAATKERERIWDHLESTHYWPIASLELLTKELDNE